MDDRPRRIREIFARVADLPWEEREAILDHECAGDPGLRREIDGILASDVTRTSQLRVPPILERLQTLAEDVEIGPYRIVGLLGEGGFGEVFVAEQAEPLRRRVALKILKAGMDTRAILSRFEGERQALALMDHPNIARVFDAGETDRGRSYFVMELIDGESLTVHAERHALSVRERLDLFVPVCRAVHHAHQKGIIHRDLKPSNILVTVADGKPVPKVIDFGIAKAIHASAREGTLLTRADEVIGTPAYMSPEQAATGGTDIDTRTDVYSLGVVLYELVTGSLPFDAGRARGERAPAKPSMRARARSVEGRGKSRRRSDSHAYSVSREIDWIVLKAIEEDRTRRYESANELALDIGRFLRDEPVLAGPPSAAYRMRKFARRHRTGIAVAVALFAVALAGSLVSNRQRIAAERARSESEAVTKFLTGMLSAVDPRAGGREVTVRQILDAKAKTIGSEFEEQPLVRARLMLTMGQVYRELNLYAEGRPLLEEAVSILERKRGAENAEVAYALNNLAILLKNSGDLAGARSAYERALAIWRKRLGPESSNVGTCLNNLANLKWQMGDLTGARAMLEQSLAIREKARGAEHLDVAQTLNNLGGLLCAMGEYTAARADLERALSIREKKLPADHPDISQVRYNLAALSTMTKDHAGAIANLEKIRETQETKLGLESPELALTLNALGGEYHMTGDGPRAREHLERALAIDEKALGPEHPDLCEVLVNLADVLRSTDPARARGLLERARRIVEAAFGPEHIAMAPCLSGLADLHEDAGERAQALPLRERSFALYKKAYGPDHSETVRARGKLAALLRSLGRTSEADALEKTGR